MKRSLLSCLACVSLFWSANGQTSVQFNSDAGTSLDEVKPSLQSHCWYIPGFEINNNGWTPGIEGDGAMVSAGTCTASQNAGIYTPLLEVAGTVHLKFKYKLNEKLSGGARRWIKIYLADYNNNLQIRLDSVELNGNNTETKTYNRHLAAGSGCYKIFINYQGTGGAACVAIDDIYVSNPLLFAEGCAASPNAADDEFGGTANHHASGNVILNDSYPTATCSAYLISNSPDGEISLQDNGTFTFVPAAGFKGNSTTFTYQICDYSVCSPLCSEPATVAINFPAAATLPASLIDFTGLYKNDGNVEVSWVTTFEQNTARFDIERSFDGSDWEMAGTLKAQGSSSGKHPYSFVDHVGRNTANKKDLYYRLKQVDLDNRAAISRILVVRVYNTESLKMISVTPNPARNDIAANIQLNQPSIAVLKVMTSAGTQVIKKTLKLGAGSNNILMDGTHTLTAGMYFLEVIINSNERMIVKLIKE